MKQTNFLFGAAYYDEYMPYDRIDIDMKLMKNAGINVIRIAESTWSTWEPQDNTYDFTHLHRMLDAAFNHDIKVIIGTPTYAIPSWLAKKHPDILALNKNGQEIYGRRQLTDITNPNYLYHAERIIRHLMEEVNDAPHVIGFQLDNETRSAGAASPATQALFVEQLKNKYPDIDDFNHEFGLNFWSNRISSWDDFPDIRGTINGSLSAAYKLFLRDCITNFLTWQSNILREYMRPEQFITHNFDFSWIGYSHGIQPEVNQFDAAKCVDIAGIDVYHLSQDNLTGSTIAFAGSVGRTLKKDNYLVLETQSQGLTKWLPYPGQLRLQAYSHLASGANSLLYWNWHSIHNSFESYWKGILSHDLKPGAAYNELSAFRTEMLPIESRITNLKKECSVAIVIDNSSLTGLDEFPISDSLDYNSILRWMYDSCYELNLECDLLSVDDDFDRYSLVLVPALYSATETTIAKLREYAYNGGHLLLGFKSCFADEELKIRSDMQPYSLTDCVGASYNQFTIPKDVTLSLSLDNHSASYKVSEWMELLEASDADVWAYYEHPFWNQYAAITHNTFGKGDVTYLGCYTEKAGLKQLLSKICTQNNIQLPNYTFPIIRKQGINDCNKLITYYFNYSSQEVSFEFDGSSGKNLLTEHDIISGQTCYLKPWDLIIIES